MKQLKRLDVTPRDPYKRALKQRLRHIALSAETFQELQRARPDRVLIVDDGILIAQPYQGMIALQYAFPTSDSFTRLFPDMFKRLLQALTLDEAPMGIRLRLTDAASRPYVDPILLAHAFEIARDWLRMELRELPGDGAPDDALADGFLLRDARVEDVEAIAELDAVAFPMSWLTPDVVRDSVEQGPVFRILEDTESARAVGFLRLRKEGAAEGYVSDIVLHPNYQRRGLGEGMMIWALAHFRKDGQRAAALTVSTDNRAAIAPA